MTDKEVKDPNAVETPPDLEPFEAKKLELLKKLEETEDKFEKNQDEEFVRSILGKGDENDDEDDDESSGDDSDSGDEGSDESAQGEESDDTEADELEKQVLAAIKKERESREAITKKTKEQEELESYRELFEQLRADPFAAFEALVPDTWSKYEDYKNKTQQWSSLSPAERQVLELKKELESLKAELSGGKDKSSPASKKPNEPSQEGDISPDLQAQIDKYISVLTKESEKEDYKVLSAYCKAKNLDLVKEASAYAGTYMEQNPGTYMSPDKALQDLSEVVRKELKAAQSILTGDTEQESEDESISTNQSKKVSKKSKSSTGLTNKSHQSSSKTKSKMPEDHDEARKWRALRKLEEIEAARAAE